MSKKNPNYRNSFADKFTRWVKGDYDPIVGQMEMNAPDKEVFGDERIRYVHLHIVKSNNYSERMFEEGLPRMSEGLQAFIRFLVQLWQSLLPVCFFGR